MKNFIFIAFIALSILSSAGAVSLSPSTEGLSPDDRSDGSKGGSLIAEIAGPSNWAQVWGVAYHDDHNMLYVSSKLDDEVAYGAYSGGRIVTWTVFDNVEAVCGLGCYQDDLLFALTWSNPLHPVPYYLYTWNLDASGVPLLPADVYELGTPFTGSLGGCEWDGEYLWIVDNYTNCDIYKYDVSTHSVMSNWTYSEPGGIGIACVWITGDIRIWISDWYGGYKLSEHSETGVLTGLSYSIITSPLDIAYKYDMNFDGPGFFVGNWFASTVDFYDHYPMTLDSSTWGCIKAGFVD